MRITISDLCFLAAALLIALPASATPAPVAALELKVEPGEYWWGGWTSDAGRMPFGATSTYERELAGDTGGNQSQPLLVSSRGRYVWSEQPYRFRFANGVLSVSGAAGALEQGRAGASVRDATLTAAKQFFPSDGAIPAPLMFTHPQYNTWIELMYDQNQAGVLEYARAIVAQGYPPGVLMIDDNWQADYGWWRFSRDKFPDPKAMMDELHRLGFRVMLWVCPYISPDSEVHRDLARRGFLVREPARTGRRGDRPAILSWWNGYSSALDLTNPGAVAWFRGELDTLVREFGVDGFKFDAGDAEHYLPAWLSHKPASPNEHTEAFARVGLGYPFNEYRATWKMAGRPLAQRLRDKKHEWADLQTLIPGMISQGVLGYAYTCPDMIGGGDFVSFTDGQKIDEELVVRSAQVHALMPMMQFSAAPWRVLSPENNAICRRMARLHADFGELFLSLAREAAKSGAPIVRPLCWHWPDGGFESVRDQFMIGDALMVAPVVERGARNRRIAVPPGTWQAEDGSTVRGPRTIDVSVPLERLPYFRRSAD